MIEFDHVSMAYQLSEDLALKNVSFKVERGEFVFIIGSSGSGKSTIIKLLTCEERPLKGEIIVNGFSLNTIKKKQIPFLRRNIGMVFQDFRLIPSKTVFENVSYAMEIVGASRKAILHQVPMVLSIVGLRNRQSAYPYELSGGEQQRVAIARAMVNRPMMILADEPTGNLDPANSESIMALLAEINKNGTTVLVCTHDKDLVNRMKRRVILIDDGMKIRDDNAGGFYAEEKYPSEDYAVAADYMGPDYSAGAEAVANTNANMHAAVNVSANANETYSTPETVLTAPNTPATKLASAAQAAQVTGALSFAKNAAAKQSGQLASDSEPSQARPAYQAINVGRVGDDGTFSPATQPQQQQFQQPKQPKRQVEPTAMSWGQAVRNSLYHEQSEDQLFADDKLLALPEDDLADDAELTASKPQHSSLSSERIERWGKRRF